jgi:hypothetical protein
MVQPPISSAKPPLMAMRVCDREQLARRLSLDRLLRPLRDELFPLSAKPFRVLGATVLKPLRGTDCAKDAPERHVQGAQNKSNSE